MFRCKVYKTKPLARTFPANTYDALPPVRPSGHNWFNSQISKRGIRIHEVSDFYVLNGNPQWLSADIVENLNERALRHAARPSGLRTIEQVRRVHPPVFSCTTASRLHTRATVWQFVVSVKVERDWKFVAHAQERYRNC